jgi:hypothetical protein
MKAFDPNLGFEILMERADGNYRQLRQFVFIEQATGKTGHIPVGEKMTPEELRAAYNRLELTSPEAIPARAVVRWRLLSTPVSGASTAVWIACG